MLKFENISSFSITIIVWKYSNLTTKLYGMENGVDKHWNIFVTVFFYCD